MLTADLRQILTAIAMCLAITATAAGGESTAKAAKIPELFNEVVEAEVRAGLINTTPLTVYTSANAPTAPKVEELEKRKTLSQYGITWTFDKEVPVGRFINGDWYVVGPVTVVMIDPKPLFGDEITEGFIKKDQVDETKYPGKQARHGSVLNPKIQQNAVDFTSYCGLDSRLPSDRFKAELSGHLPFAMKPGDCLLSSISRRNDEIRVFGGQHANPVRAVAVLNCVAEPLPTDAFRPSFCDTANNASYRSRNLKRDLLLKLPKMPGTPANLARYARILERPYADLADFGFSCPQENMPHYGQQMIEYIGEATLLLQMDYSPEEKERTLVNLIQVGIDFWGMTRAGRKWQVMGGLNQGRKWPIIFAGMLLDDQQMQSPKKIVPGSRWHEDEQTAMCPYNYDGKVFEQTWTGAKAFFVGHSLWTDPGDRGKWLKGSGPIDLFHPKDWPLPEKEELGSNGYRMANTSGSWIGQALSARLMHAENVWDHEAFFAYVDRWMTEDATIQVEALKAAGRKDRTKVPRGAFYRQGCVNGEAKWVKEMWLKYRNNLPLGPNGEKTPNAENTWK